MRQDSTVAVGLMRLFNAGFACLSDISAQLFNSLNGLL
jgi:hypothetical protein